MSEAKYESKEDPSSGSGKRNLAVVYMGKEEVQIKDIGYPQLKDPQGRAAPHAVIVKSIATNICGSDLHMYRGRTSYPPGRAFGHEITGEVVEKGSHVGSIQIGDWVSIPFNISCGTCENCKQRLTSLCLSVNPKQPGGAFGFADMGGWQGGQAEYVLVPYADWNCLVLPKDVSPDYIKDLAMLSDILPTGFSAAVAANVTVGRFVYIAGAGPVGICCAASCLLLGATLVVVGDMNASRLANIAKLDPAIKTLDLSKIGSNPTDLKAALRAVIGREQVDCSCDCVGFESCGHGNKSNDEDSTIVLNSCFAITKAGGKLGVVGLYPPEDPQGKTEDLKQGLLPLKYGAAWSKSISIAGGQCPVMSYHRELMMSIIHKRIRVSDVLNVKVISLQEVPEAYKKFNQGDAVKYIIDPHGYIPKTTVVFK